MKAGRPVEVKDRITMAVVVGEWHRDYIDALAVSLKKSTGAHFSRSAAIRRIIEDHAQSRGTQPAEPIA